MHIVIFGLCMSSSWGNGHATLWRGLVRALSRRRHTVTFYEKDVPYYAANRDGWEPPGGVRLRLYREFADISREAATELRHTDLALSTSYCADGIAAARLLLDSAAGLKVFYDLDSPVTLSRLRLGINVAYLPPEGLAEFDLVLSFTGGRALEELNSHLGAQRVEPLYGWVDPEVHTPAARIAEFRSELCYLGTYAADRQHAVERLFVDAARFLPATRFAIGGAQYPEEFPWTSNIFFVRHLPPSLHPAFFCSARATLNVTREAMARYGFCPSGRLFEAAACGVPILSDQWEGLDSFFQPGTEILAVRDTSDVLDALSLTDHELTAIGVAAYERTLQCHTATRRVLELEAICDSLHQSVAQAVLVS